ncbi:MAG: cytochrome c biogenesis protein CcsA [Planctomycetaceae bacterium]
MTGQGVSLFCFLASYVLAFGLEWVRLLKTQRKWRVLAPLAGTAGWVAHTWYLWARGSEARLPPLLSSTQDWFLVLAWMAVLFYLVLTAVDAELPVGMFVLPLVLLLVGSARFASADTSVLLMENLDARRGWVMLHATLLVFGVGVVMLGFVLSMMYLVQHRRLRHKQAGQSGMMLPSLERLSRLNWWAVVLTAPLLTLGMLTGVILGVLPGGNQPLLPLGDPLVIVSGLVWVVSVAFLFWLLSTGRPLGKAVAWRTIWAFGFLLITLIGLLLLTGEGPISLNTMHTKAESGKRKADSTTPAFHFPLSAFALQHHQLPDPPTTP